MIILSGRDNLFAADDVVVRLAAKPETAWLGERVVLKLDVLGKGGWAQLKRGHAKELSGGYLKRYEAQGTRLQETIDGAAYTGQQYEYLFFPQRGGEVTLAPVTIEVETKYWGGRTESVLTTVSTPPFTLDIKVPPGVSADQTLVSTSRLIAKQSWNPDITELKAGDSVTRTITLEAEDVSGMVFPPMLERDLPGVGLYPVSPTVEDKYYRGTLTGHRVEEIVYVPEQGGEFSASELTFSWWNTSSEKLETVNLEGRDFSVTAVPGVSASTRTGDAEHVSSSRAKLIWISAAAALVILVLLFVGKPLLHSYKRWQKKRNESETAYFRRVGRAVRGKDGVAVLNSSLDWLDCISTSNVSPRMDLFLSEYGEPESLEQYLNFSNSLYSGDNHIAVKSYYSALAKARSRWRESLRAKQRIDDILPSVGIES